MSSYQINRQSHIMKVGTDNVPPTKFWKIGVSCRTRNTEDGEDHDIVTSIYDIDARHTGQWLSLLHHRCGLCLHKGAPVIMVQGGRMVATSSPCWRVCQCKTPT
jgi:hypothetical protein